VFLASDRPSGRMGELRDKFHEHNDAFSLFAVCRILGLPSSHFLSTLRPPCLCFLPSLGSSYVGCVRVGEY
jgi:hypothetical protein